MAERLRLELRTRITPSDRLAICSNTIIGPFHIETHCRLSLRLLLSETTRSTTPKLSVFLYGAIGRLRTYKGCILQYPVPDPKVGALPICLRSHIYYILIAICCQPILNIMASSVGIEPTFNS